MKKRAIWILVIAGTVLSATLIFLAPSEAKRSVNTVSDNDKRSVTTPADNKKASVTTVSDNSKATPAQVKAKKGRVYNHSLNQYQEGNVTVFEPYHADISPALTDMKPAPYTGRKGEREANENPRLPRTHKDSPDTVVQTWQVGKGLLELVSPSIPSPILNFDGILYPGVACFCAPPDTDGEVGDTQYTQMVNEGFQVFSKATGASVFGPVGISTVWTGFGGACEFGGAGDPVVLYDQFANRWILTQFATPTGGIPITDECVAVSTTSNAAGAYARYGYHLGSNFFDYPHLSVWPSAPTSNAYFMSMNVFNSSGTAFLGPQPFAFNRAKMIAADPSAEVVSTGITTGIDADNSYLPADLDGSTLPPAGSPGTFVTYPAHGVYNVYHMAVTFPSTATFTLFASPAAAGFVDPCATRACIPEPGGNFLDGISDRLMFRAADRFLPGGEALVANFTVSGAASGAVGSIRWFELRNVTAGPVTVAQEATYSPDTTSRWMGSAAMDGSGNLALGFSASSTTVFPRIRYTGRLATDPINTLPQGEADLGVGTGAQSGTGNRWGDYSDMTIDPIDDCTFWYTQEYYSVTGAFNWRTRIANFKFPTCGGPPQPILNPNGITLVNESCPPLNNAADPGERISIDLGVINNGNASTTAALTGTLLPSPPNVLAPSGPMNYGVIAPGNTVKRTFTVTVDGTCGQTITFSLQLQDGSTNLGTVTYTMQLGSTVVSTVFSENFDGVTAPALPAGWTTAATGVESPWVTSTTTPFSAPNDAFAPDPSFIGNTELFSPVIAIPASGAQLTFKNFYNTESTFDGMVLEISINGGAYADILAAGGSFTAGGYNSTISTAFGSPIGGRQAWSGNSGTYINSTANLPPAANGQPIQLKWRMASDNSVAVVGVRIDNIVISSTSIVCNSSCRFPRLVVTQTMVRSGPNVDMTICVENQGVTPATSVVVTSAMLSVAGAPLPSFPSIGPGVKACSSTPTTFTGQPAGPSTLKIKGTFNPGGTTFSKSQNVIVP